jgi:hypothetical protein
MKTLTTQQLSEMAAMAAASRGACASGGAYTWLGNDLGNSIFADRKVIATPKHRLRRPEDRSH